ncbi:MAG: acetyl-CoA carboxylase biotin carboxylase subunit, partial [Alphaproteobacteria bacterium]
CRVMRTAKRMGIATVAVYSEADEDALHMLEADEAVPIGPAPSAQSYLVVKNILRAIKKTGADAVHPGYGFLSENAAFAETLAEAGIAFIGPGPAAIAAMGDKIESKKIAKAAGINTVPGHIGVIEDDVEAVRIAKGIGYPVMIKASAGGGGKGMRVARDDDEVRDGFRAARSEAKSSFADDRVFIEKFIEEPRHIEIQILADAHGNVIHLGERECSIQRRHQKVIEEAPSPFVDARMRAAMGRQAVKLAKAVNYKSAGTVEFIVDAKKNFYFLEMNTRLQVEHPVTEMVTGLDLVEEMIRVAAGEKLRLKQKDVTMKGWAVEARIYAEDPARDFLPSIGRLSRYRAPADDKHVRVDSGVAEGSEISIYYDPMIAKLVTYGRGRAEAIRRMGAAMDGFYVRGVDHNIAFLAAVMAHPRFRKGNLTTNFIEDEFPDGFKGGGFNAVDIREMAAVAAFLQRRQSEREAGISGQMMNRPRMARADWVVRIDGKDMDAALTPDAGGYDIRVGRKTYALRSDWVPGAPLFEGSLDGRAIIVQVRRLVLGYRLFHGGVETDAQVLSPRATELVALMPEKTPPDTSKFLLSPMPGLLLRINGTVGQEVKSGEELAVVEAMKMENVLRAERDGVIAVVHAGAGDSLVVDQPIIEFE